MNSQQFAALLPQLGLQVLNISRSSLLVSMDVLPEAWSRLPLQALDISFTYQPGNPTRSIPQAWCSMQQLQVLQAEGAGIDGALSYLPLLNGCMPGLLRLILPGNPSLRGTLPAGRIWAAINHSALTAERLCNLPAQSCSPAVERRISLSFLGCRSSHAEGPAFDAQQLCLANCCNHCSEFMLLLLVCLWLQPGQLCPFLSLT